jgi:hypothetical protein
MYAGFSKMQTRVIAVEHSRKSLSSAKPALTMIESCRNREMDHLFLGNGHRSRDPGSAASGRSATVRAVAG